MKNLGNIIVAIVLILVGGFMFLMGLDSYKVGADRFGAYLYEGEQWMDEVAFTRYLVSYPDGRLEAKEIAPNTVLVEYHFVTRAELAGLDRRILSRRDFEVYGPCLIGITAMVFALLVPASCCWANIQTDKYREEEK